MKANSPEETEDTGLTKKAKHEVNIQEQDKKANEEEVKKNKKEMKEKRRDKETRITIGVS